MKPTQLDSVDNIPNIIIFTRAIKINKLPKNYFFHKDSQRSKRDTEKQIIVGASEMVE